MANKEHFSIKLVVQAGRNMSRSVRTGDQPTERMYSTVEVPSKSVDEIRNAFKNASIKLKTG